MDRTCLGCGLKQAESSNRTSVSLRMVSRRVIVDDGRRYERIVLGSHPVAIM